MRSIAASWRLIEDVLWENAHSVFRALRKPVSAAQLTRLEALLPTKLPRDFLQSLKIHDGLRDSYFGEVRFFNYWVLLPAAAIAKECRTMTSLQAAHPFGGCQLEVSERIQNDAHWRAGWVPFLDADGDKVLMDLDPGPKGTVGQIIKWSNSGSFPTRVLADSFGEWLEAFAAALSKREFRLDQFGGIELEDERLT